MIKFPQRLKELRKKRKLELHDIAKKLGLSKRQIIRYEAGQSRPCFTNLVKICDLLSTTSDYILGAVDFNKSEPK